MNDDVTDDVDDDIWTDGAGAEPDAEAADRRGPARPPRRGDRREGAAVAARPGEPGGVLTEPISGEHHLGPIAGGYVDDYEDYDDGPAKLPRWVLVLGGIVVVLGILAGSVVWWYNRQLDPPGSPGDEVSVQIPRGASTSGIGSILERNDVIPNSMVFNFYASRKNAGPFEAGAYTFQENSSVDLALEVLDNGPTGKLEESPGVVKLTIPEGLTVEEVLARITKQIPRFTAADLEAALDGEVTTALRPDDATSWEGLLFPATYEIGPNRTAAEVIDLLSGEMQTRVQGYAPEGAVAAINRRYGLNLTTYDVLKVASMVQAEAGSAEEAPKIATVIYNRLAKKSTAYTLGIDAVDEYGAELRGLDAVEFRAQHPEDPYNTRSVAGLPPTPIGASGDYALSAAFNPAEGPWMWYVLTDVRVHTFAVTDAEFQAAKRICVQKNLGCGR